MNGIGGPAVPARPAAVPARAHQSPHTSLGDDEVRCNISGSPTACPMRRRRARHRAVMPETVAISLPEPWDRAASTPHDSGPFDPIDNCLEHAQVARIGARGFLLERRRPACSNQRSGGCSVNCQYSSLRREQVVGEPEDELVRQPCLTLVARRIHCDDRFGLPAAPPGPHTPMAEHRAVRPALRTT
jgi:hypothetical protein